MAVLLDKIYKKMLWFGKVFFQYFSPKENQMIRIRLLLVAAFAVSVSVMNYSIDYLIHAEPGKSLVELWQNIAVVLIFVSLFSIISSIAIFVLTLVAMKPDKTGTFAISRRNLYGRMFLLISGGKSYKTSSGYNSSVCAIFWKTNFCLFLISLLVSIVAGAAIALYGFGFQNLAIFVASSGFFALLLLKVAFPIFSFVRKRIPNWLKRLAGSKRFKVAIGTLALAGLVTGLILNLGFWPFLMRLGRGLMWVGAIALFVWAFCICLSISSRLRRAFENTQFACWADEFLHKTACPWIVISDT